MTTGRPKIATPLRQNDLDVGSNKQQRTNSEGHGNIVRSDRGGVILSLRK
jgi:hypothetical protein